MSQITRRLILGAAAAAALSAPAAAKPVVGQPAPAFQAVDADGRTRSLAEFRGRTVVLEWTNNGCPYVKRNYSTGAMQSAQRQAKDRGAAVWLTVASSAPGQQGYMTGAEAKAWQSQAKSAPTAILLDPDGKIGRLYGAKTTPHMFVIDGGGRIAYMGAIDDKPTNDPTKAAGAKNYVLAALDDIRAGRKVAQPVTRPYGCSVKYAG
jgi:peroxiredoxin